MMAGQNGTNNAPEELRALEENFAQDEAELKAILEKITGGPVNIDTNNP